MSKRPRPALPDDFDPYGKDAFSFPGGGSGVGYATKTPECFKHPAPVEVIRMEVTPEQRLEDLERLVQFYKGRKFLTVSFDLEDATWLIQQARSGAAGKEDKNEPTL